MGKKDVEKSAESVEEIPAVEEETEAVEVEEVSPEAVEEETAATPEELDDESNIEKKFDELHSAIKDTLEGVKADTTEKVSGLEKKIDDLQKSLETETSELRSKLDEYGDRLEATKARQAELQKSLDIINSSSAIKKSADLDSDSAVVQKVDKSQFSPGTFSLFG